MAAFLSGLLRPFDELLDAPALVRGQRPALDDLNAVAGLEFVLLVVRLVLRAAGHVLAVLLVRQSALDLHHARFVHLVAGDDADHAALMNLVTGHVSSPVRQLTVAPASSQRADAWGLARHRPRGQPAPSW